MSDIRRTAIQDLDDVMAIYARASDFMAQSGNPGQWGNGYPGRDLIAADILEGVSYVVEDETGILAVFSYIEGEDPTYACIEQGAWKTAQGVYATVHRLASAGREKGMGKVCFSWCAQRAMQHGCVSLRADTHRDNHIMQQLLERSGFEYCGIIYLKNGSPRLAYECVYDK